MNFSASQRGFQPALAAGSRIAAGRVCLLLAIALASAEAQTLDRTQARSMVVSRYGIVATEQPLASQAGAMILAQGGNAIDAAVAANAAVAVVQPMMCGIGGDLFAIVYEAKSDRLYGLNASGWAPAGLTLEHLRHKGLNAMPQSGIDAVTVPGAVAGWDQLLRRFGRKNLATVLAPATRLAADGFPVPELDSGYWAVGERLLRREPEATRTYLPGGHAPRLGQVFRNPDLAWSYRQIAARGRKAVYGGAIGRRIVACSQRLGGTMTLADLEQFSAAWVDPISTTYRDWTVYELPPNGQGIAALTMLNLMENFPLAEYGHHSADALHVMIEAKKLAYADLLRYVGDPKFSRVPVAGILSKAYARRRAALIDLWHANPHVAAGTPPGAAGETTYLCAVDRDGNMVSLIQSNYGAFGSGVVPDGAGF
ncbi:MAG: gamma-glutamyltransferase family protein, partial [Verrucomicrobia bacterium]|nr:gamma-glutamyltransferase family protein [Verrucomicrobiota bacterium]